MMKSKTYQLVTTKWQVCSKYIVLWSAVLQNAELAKEIVERTSFLKIDGIFRFAELFPDLFDI